MECISRVKDALSIKVTPCRYPALCMHSEGSSDCSWTGLYIYMVYISANFDTQKILTFRSPFKAALRVYRFAAGQVFVAFENPC